MNEAAAMRPERRSGRRRGGDDPHMRPARTARYRQLVNPFEPMRVVSDETVVRLHDTALRVLEEVGVRVLHEGARTCFRKAGALVDDATMMVRISREIITTALTTLPRQIDFTALNAERNVTIGGKHVGIIPVGGPPHVSDIDRGKRSGTLRDYKDLVRLSQHFDVIHVNGACLEPQDVPVQFRHLEMTLAQLTLTDNVPFAYARGRGQVADAFAMMQIAHGISAEEFEMRPYTYTVINTNSPLQLDLPMSQGIIDFARAGQVTVITPFTLAGAMAPITIPGALAQSHAEALAGITLAQLVRPGAPVVYGGFTSNVDMRSGAPAFGTPEYVKAAFGAGQLARHIGAPWRSSNVNTSNIVDAQAMYESQMSLWGALMGGCNLLIHGAGWLEGGLVASFEKFILDVEMLQMFAELFQPLSVSEDDLGFDAIAGVGPGGHYFASPHTMTRYDSAFYAPLVSDWRNFGQWKEDGGGRTATQRANRIWKDVLDQFRTPAKDPATTQALSEFVAKRKETGGSPPVS